MPARREGVRERLARWWHGEGRGRGAGSASGARGESIAERMLIAKGYRLLGRNLRLRRGEIDLLCLAPDGATIVVVEVKAREFSEGVRTPEAAITAHKQRKLRTLARDLVRANAWQNRPIRIDVVAVELGGAGECRHHEAAIRA